MTSFEIANWLLFWCKVESTIVRCEWCVLTVSRSEDYRISTQHREAVSSQVAHVKAVSVGACAGRSHVCSIARTSTAVGHRFVQFTRPFGMLETKQ